jgi:hypothetical protein
MVSQDVLVVIVSISFCSIVYILHSIWKQIKRCYKKRRYDRVSDHSAILPQYNVTDHPSINPLHTNFGGYPNYQSHRHNLPEPGNSAIVSVPNHNRLGLVSRQQEELINSILTPTKLDPELDDMSDYYNQMVIRNNPEYLLMPLMLLDDTYRDENCCICCDVLKIKSRPVIKLSCDEHYLHYSCYMTLAEDANKKKSVEYIFGQVKHINEMFAVACPFCQTDVYLDKIFVKYPETSNINHYPSQTSIEIDETNVYEDAINDNISNDDFDE